MDTPLQIALTPEQIAAVQAGAGYARFEDPRTHRVYLLAEQSEQTISDEYIREKLAEAEGESKLGLCEPWDTSALKAELRARLAGGDTE
jgi:hypothetical protein